MVSKCQLSFYGLVWKMRNCLLIAHDFDAEKCNRFCLCFCWHEETWEKVMQIN